MKTWVKLALGWLAFEVTWRWADRLKGTHKVIADQNAQLAQLRYRLSLYEPQYGPEDLKKQLNLDFGKSGYFDATFPEGFETWNVACRKCTRIVAPQLNAERTKWTCGACLTEHDRVSQ